MEKVVASKQLRLAVETEEERRARLENDATIKQLSLAMEMNGERKARLEKMVAPYSSGWPWRQRKKEEQKKVMDMIWISFVLRLEFSRTKKFKY